MNDKLEVLTNVLKKSPYLQKDCKMHDITLSHKEGRVYATFYKSNYDTDVIIKEVVSITGKQLDTYNLSYQIHYNGEHIKTNTIYSLGIYSVIPTLKALPDIVEQENKKREAKEEELSKLKEELSNQMEE